MITVWVTLCEYPVLYSYFLRSQADAVVINRAFTLYILCLWAGFLLSDMICTLLLFRRTRTLAHQDKFNAVQVVAKLLPRPQKQMK